MDPEIHHRLTSVGTTSLCDADPSIRAPAGLSCANTPRRVAGIARTVSCAGDLLPVLRGLETLQPGEVLVVNTGGSALAVAGELFTLHAQNAGAAALIVDGFIRDIDTVRTLAVPVYARGVHPRAGRAQVWGDVQVPVTCGGVDVAPGDLVVADADGVVVLAEAQATAAIERAEQIEQSEARIRAALRDRRSLFDMFNFDEVTAAFEGGGSQPLQLRPPG